MPKVGRTKVAARSQKLIHPQSRKANRLGAREIHKERVRKVHQETNLKTSLQIDKLMWFQEALDPDRQSYSKADAQDLVARYLERFEEELEQISIVNSMKSRSGRQHAAREDIINSTKRREQELFNTCGIEIPDIVDAGNLKVFRKWDGNERSISTLKMRKIVRTEDKNPTRQPTLQDQNDDQIDDEEDILDRVDDEENENDDDDDDEGVEDDMLESDNEDVGQMQENLEDEGVES